MQSTTPTLADEVAAPQAGMPVFFYAANLTDGDLRALPHWANHCMQREPAAPRLAAYLCCVAEFESQRRNAIERGDEVIEVFMTPLPCQAWPTAEVVAALLKTNSLELSASGEVRRLFEKLHTLLVVEAAHRLENR